MSLRKDLSGGNVIVEDNRLKTLLRHFDLEELYPALHNARITFNNLKYLNQDDIKEVIKPVGLRAEFREKLFSFLKYEKDVDEESDDSYNSLDTNKEQKPSKPPTPEPTPAPNVPHRLNPKAKFLSHLLQSTTRGQAVLSFYAKNSNLSTYQRNDLTQIVVEDVISKNTKLRPKHFTTIVDQIVAIFPSENRHRDFYYIPRERTGKNPRGRLYSKYFNLKTKQRKLNRTLEACEAEIFDANHFLVKTEMEDVDVDV